MPRLLPLATLAVLLPLAHPAATSAQGAPPPACADARHRAFDFWIGDWTVTDSAGGTTYGSNVITKEEGGCLVHEHWTGSKGGSGQSLNAFDAEVGLWSQDWVGSGGEVLHLTGQLVDGRMVLEGRGKRPDGGPLRHKATWSPEPGGRVRQYWVTSADDGATWQVFFDGWYRRRAG